MSGYLDVKYPFKANLGLNPFKSWKRQWCILRPSPTCSGGSFAVYSSESGGAAGSVDLPSGCVVRRAKSRSRPFAFAIFAADDPRKPLILLASQTLHDSQSWMEKIRSLLNGSRMLGTETLLKDSYTVTIQPTEFTTKCGLPATDATLTISSQEFTIATDHRTVSFEWKLVTDAQLAVDEDDNRICVFTVDRGAHVGGGRVLVRCVSARALVSAARARAAATRRARARALSRSDGDLRARRHRSAGEVRRSSWYSGPSDVSLDDIDLVMSKESKRIPSGQLSRCSADLDLAPHGTHAASAPAQYSFDESMSDRRSLLSVASGIYEEIPDLPARADADGADATDGVYCKMGQDAVDGMLRTNAEQCLSCPEEPTYESVSECAYASMRRAPPLPPRARAGTVKERSWSGGVTRHGSLCSLAGHAGRAGLAGETARGNTLTLPKARNKQPFSVFRKRLKSDSRIATSPKSDISKENKDVEPKKKKFDFAPTRDIFKNFKVNRKMKNLKITTNTLTKGETKSCEFLDEAAHVPSNRCSKSVECLEDEFIDDVDDLSIEFNDNAVAALALPQEIVDLILRSREQITRIRLKEASGASGCMPLPPIIHPPQPLEHHYIVMSPKTNLA